MTGPGTVVFIHGQRGPEQLQSWLEPLNRRLAELKHSGLDETVDSLISVAYLDELRAGADGPAPQDTWVKAEDSAFASAESAYQLRRSELARVVARWQKGPGGLDFSFVPRSPLNDVIADQMEPVRLYKKEPRHRHAAQRCVLRQLPRSGSAVVIGHSLGSVLAADILTKLPPDLTVTLLLTIGSPLAIETLGTSSKQLASAFPYDRVHAWVNVFDPRDVVTFGRAISTRFPAVLDVPIDTGAFHTSAAYMSHSVVAALVGHVLFGVARAEVPPELPQRRLHPAWHPLLLNFAYTAQLSVGTEPRKWKVKRRLDTARNVIADRVIDDVEQRRAEIHEVDGARVAHEMDDSPVGSGRSPGKSDLLNHAADLVRDTWSDTELAPLAVSLAMSPPLPPFDIHISVEHRHRALWALLNRVRRRQGDLTDERFATGVKESVAAAEGVLNERGFPWGKILIFGGLAVLALTGVGLAAAATAATGLAGAAAITATMAAFGPGGMVGGMATLAALTGVGTALTGAGLSQELAPGSEPFEALRFWAAHRLAMGSSAELRTTVAGMLAVIGVQKGLGFHPSTSVVEDVLLKIQADVSKEQRLYEYVAPNRPGTAEWKTKTDILRRALEWVEKQPEVDAARKEIRKLIEA